MSHTNPLSDSPHETRLREATEVLKSVFGKYEKPPVEQCVDAMGGPIPEAAIAAWAASPWDYRPEDMDDFIWHSIVLLGFPSTHDHEELVLKTKYWLPRLLFGLSEGEACNVIQDEFISRTMISAEWSQWPADEVDAVRQWCFAWFAACFAYNSRTNKYNIHYVAARSGANAPDMLDVWDGGRVFDSGPARSAADCLEFAVSIGLDLSPALFTMTGEMGQQEVRSIQDIVVNFAPRVMRRDDLESQTPATLALRSLLRWMLHPATRERLENDFYRFADTDPATERELSETHVWLEIVRKSFAADPRGMPPWLSETSDS